MEEIILNFERDTFYVNGLTIKIKCSMFHSADFIIIITSYVNVQYPLGHCE